MRRDDESKTIIAVAATIIITSKKRSLESRERDIYILINIALLSIFARKHLL